MNLLCKKGEHEEAEFACVSRRGDRHRGLFVFGWVLQFVGHYVYEKRSPAFMKNLTHLLVGPLWILAKATRRT